MLTFVLRCLRTSGTVDIGCVGAVTSGGIRVGVGSWGGTRLGTADGTDVGGTVSVGATMIGDGTRVNVGLLPSGDGVCVGLLSVVGVNVNVAVDVGIGV